MPETEGVPNFNLSYLDYATVGIYVIFIVALGIYFSRRMKTSDDYFLAGRSLPWWLVGFSLLASNMSSTSMVGMAGEAYQNGIAVFNYEWMVGIVLAFFVIFFLPEFLSSRVYTMPEFLERRFDSRARYYLSVITIIGNILIDTAGTLFAGAIAVQIIYPDFPLWASVVILAVLAGLYTIAGGLKAVVYTDFVQAILLLGGATAVTVLAFMRVGSWQAVKDVTPDEMLGLIQPAVGGESMPWPTLITGVFLLGFYFWCNNQFMVQRILGSRSMNDGRWGSIFAGFLKLPLLFIMVLPGAFARVMYPEIERADMVYPTMIFDLLPVGVRGMVLTALLAAIMSSVDSTINSASTLVTMDFVNKLKPEASQRTLVWTGRLTAFVFMLLAAVWAPMILHFETLWQYLQMVLAYLSPPVVACFILGVFWKRANGHGAFYALLGGHLSGIGVFFLQRSMDFHFLYVPAILFAISTLILIALSLATPPPAFEKTQGFVWTPASWRAETQELAALPWWQNYRWWTVLLVLCTVGLVAWWA